MWITITAEAKRARKLSGMKYHGGESRQFWLDLVGIDPASVRGVRIETGRHGDERCYWTADAWARIYAWKLNAPMDAFCRRCRHDHQWKASRSCPAKQRFLILI